MSKADGTHFDTYRDQTKIKHHILESYLEAFIHALKKYNERLVYIDGFAGSGSYGQSNDDEAHDGSPVRALRLIAGNADFAERVKCVFIERRQDYAEELKRRVKQFCDAEPDIHEPIVVKGEFADVVDAMVEEVGAIAPTLLFVDPCGVSGVSMDAIKKILANRSCELLLFFNIDGVRRIAGLMKDSVVSPTLVQLFGSEARARACADDFQATDDSDARERIILDHYRKALEEEASMRYFIRFRVEHENRTVTSHYLLHATTHPLGFKIMKHIMWEAGRNPGETEGSLQLLQASVDQTATLIRPDIAALKSSILEHLNQTGAESVKTFREVWVERTDDIFTDGVYRRVLLELEAEGRIEVVDPVTGDIAGPDDRRKRKGEPTLATRYLVRLKA